MPLHHESTEKATSQLLTSISAPASMQNSPESGSLTTVAVRPAAEEDLPEVYTARGTSEETYLRI